MKKFNTFLCALLLASVFSRAEDVPVRRLSVSEVKLAAFDGVTNDEFGVAVAVDGDVALVGAAGDDNTRGAAYVFERGIGGTNAWGLVAKLTAPDAAPDDWFGFSVAVDGDVALIGAYGNDDAGSGSGSAYVFERNIGGTNAWGYVCKLTAADAASADYFGVAVAADGDVALVSASGDESFRGSAYVFQRNAGGTNAWGQVAKIVAPDGVPSDYFGVSVSVAGDVALAGAEKDDGLGSAYVFERNIGGTNAWGWVAKLTASDGASGDNFGYSVSADGDTALIGAYGSDGNRGAAYVYQRNFGGTNVWGEVTKLAATDGEGGDHFGWSVAVDGGTALIGAYKDDDDGSESGAAYVFERNANGPNAWGQVRKLTASDGSAGDWFGCAVAACGNTALIGAFHDDPSGTFSGSAYVMPVSIEVRDYQEVSKLFAADIVANDRFGWAVSASGDLALIGAVQAMGLTGAAYIFERSHDGSNAWLQSAMLTASDGASLDRYGHSVSVDGDVALIGAYRNDESGTSGAAYIYERNAGGTNAWGEVSKLTSSDGAFFGKSVSLAGDVALVGAPGDETQLPSTYLGAAYIFERNARGANAWGEASKLTGSDSAAEDEFGCSVAIAGDVAVIGAYGYDHGHGAVYVFERNFSGTNAWGQVARLTASDGVIGSAFGYSVSIDGDTVLVGAISGMNGEGIRTGSSYVFERNTGGTNAWGETAKIVASDGEDMDYFGYSVCIDGDVAIIGTAWEGDSAYICERNAGGTNAWGEMAKLTDPPGAISNRFGSSVSLDGDVALIGALLDNAAATNAGAAYIFERHFPVPGTAIEEMQMQGPKVVCAWTSEVPVDYTLQVSESMDDGASWSNVTGSVDLPGVDGMITVTNDLDAGPQRFYRVKTVNSPIR